jgi:hypothetical protein
MSVNRRALVPATGASVPAKRLRLWKKRASCVRLSARFGHDRREVAEERRHRLDGLVEVGTPLGERVTEPVQGVL